jgi:hypothetical protein
MTLQTCLGNASKAGGPCANAVGSVTSICTQQGVTDAETKCQGTKFVFEGPIKAQCVGAL